MTTKERALEIFKLHLPLASQDGKKFRKTVIEQIMEEFGCSLSSASTHYNNAKKTGPAVEGLGRTSTPATNQSVGAVLKKTASEDDPCFSVLEIVDGLVARCQSFLIQGDASEKFDEKVAAWPNTKWVMIEGLGPISGERYRLEPEEKEIKAYTPVD